jgi:hypothetical protein
MKNKIVYILGAGCSADYGYPLAKDFRDALREYGDTLGQRPNCERLKQCVARTLSLMEKHQSPTIDRLVFQIAEDFGRQRRRLGVNDPQRHIELENAEEEQILDAKRATTAFFLEREFKARETGLQGYRDFFNIVFEGDRNHSVLESTTSRVLSFNYDRLFEIAFADYFRLDSNAECYRQFWLNSGLDLVCQQAADLLPNQFSFLKLHGTAGIFVARQIGVPRYYGLTLYDPSRTINDDLIWPLIPSPFSPQGQIAEPLIVFPFEKDRARSGGTSFLFDDYIRAIWGQPKHQGYAETLVQEAQQIRVIGYSFDPNDRKAMIDLLRKSADSPIIIRNRTREQAQEICDKLGEDHSDLAPRLKASPKPF